MGAVVDLGSEVGLLKHVPHCVVGRRARAIEERGALNAAAADCFDQPTDVDPETRVAVVAGQFGHVAIARGGELLGLDPDVRVVHEEHADLLGFASHHGGCCLDRGSQPSKE